MTYINMTYINMTYINMTYINMTYKIMTHINMTYINSPEPPVLFVYRSQQVHADLCELMDTLRLLAASVLLTR